MALWRKPLSRYVEFLTDYYFSEMEHLSEILTIVNTALLPILGFFLFYNSRRREARAKAEREEIHNVSSISDEWQELYKKAEEKLAAKDAKIDQLYAEKESDRQRIRELSEQNNALKMEHQAAKFKECTVRGCEKRQPPSGY